MSRHASIVAVAIVLALPGCGGDDDPPRDSAETSTPTPPPAATGLPPEFVQCMADRGYVIKSADDVHSAPEQALQQCFGVLHGRP